MTKTSVVSSSLRAKMHAKARTKVLILLAVLAVVVSVVVWGEQSHPLFAPSGAYDLSSMQDSSVSHSRILMLTVQVGWSSNFEELAGDVPTPHLEAAGPQRTDDAQMLAATNTSHDFAEKFLTEFAEQMKKGQTVMVPPARIPDLRSGDIVIGVSRVNADGDFVTTRFPDQKLMAQHAADGDYLAVLRSDRLHPYYIPNPGRRIDDIMFLQGDPPFSGKIPRVTPPTADVTGPSVGLALALSYLQLGVPFDLYGSRTIAATGEINSLGQVTAIGGAPEKATTVGVVGADVMFVPAVNAAAAARVLKTTPVVPVYTLAGALKWFCTHGQVSLLCLSQRVMDA